LIVGAEVDCLSDAELSEHIMKFQDLVDNWLDEFELQAFDGKTPRQTLSGD
jgi:hypothetical protein